ncbi:hypothetical protein [Ruminococcus flavefaciens]|uniref:hypothetical protein n=1 Tax=Ruminococcus flavefaciens TaxID=1265 RepID=UPI000466881A|nr:hypothetical protein [Ruminococcus flavefaciens]
MDDFMTGIGGANDVSHMNDIARQAAQTAQDQALQAHNTAAQMHNDAVRTAQQTAGYRDTSQEYRPTPDFYAMYDKHESSDTEFVTLVKGGLGAIIGAIPGFFFIMTLARFGIIASICGTVLAAGTFFGYYVGTRRNGFDLRKGGIICIVVMLVAIFFAVRSSWVYEMRDSLLKMKSLTSALLGESRSASGSYSGTLDGASRLVLGYDKPTYSNCSDCFGKLLTLMGSKGLFIASLIENYIFCAAGAVWLFFKFGRKSYY